MCLLIGQLQHSQNLLHELILGHGPPIDGGCVPILLLHEVENEIEEPLQVFVVALAPLHPQVQGADGVERVRVHRHLVSFSKEPAEVCMLANDVGNRHDLVAIHQPP